MSNAYWRAMNTRNAVRASRDAASTGEEVVPVEADHADQAPGTTTHHCPLPRYDPYRWVGDPWDCPECGQPWVAVLRRYDWTQRAYRLHWQPR